MDPRLYKVPRFKYCWTGCNWLASNDKHYNTKKKTWAYTGDIKVLYPQNCQNLN